MKTYGILPVSNGNKLGYPYIPAIKSLLSFCDEVLVNVDTNSTDGTVESVEETGATVLYKPWDMSFKEREMKEHALQAQVILDEIKDGNLVFYMQADEMLHKEYGGRVKNRIKEIISVDSSYTTFELYRSYFWKDISTIRLDWSMFLARIFIKGSSTIGYNGMHIDRHNGRCFRLYPNTEDFFNQKLPAPYIYHYSRVGNPKQISMRIKSIDGQYHPHDTLPEDPEEYKFEHREFDCFSSREKPPTKDLTDLLVPFKGAHPKGIREIYK